MDRGRFELPCSYLQGRCFPIKLPAPMEPLAGFEPATCGLRNRCTCLLCLRGKLASPEGLAPPASTVAKWRSLCLSYGEQLAAAPGFEPGASAFGGQRPVLLGHTATLAARVRLELTPGRLTVACPTDWATSLDMAGRAGFEPALTRFGDEGATVTLPTCNTGGKGRSCTCKACARPVSNRVPSLHRLAFP